MKVFNFQLSRTADLLKARNPKGLVVPIWAFCQSLQSIAVRVACVALSSRQTKPIWLYSDRIDAAGDNAEVFFEYCAKQAPDIEHVFILSKKSPDYKRISRFGKVVKLKSFRHKLLFLMADKYFLSHPEVYFLNPYGSMRELYSKSTSVELIFLQHGITQNDLSDWLARDKVNFSKIVTASQKEYLSFLEPSYGYTTDNLIKCGFPRYDKLKSNPKNKIVIMPSWRQDLVGKMERRSNLHSYNPDFKNSDYYKFYNCLINNKRLLSAMGKADLTGEFYLHPSHTAQTCDFEPNKIFKIMSAPYDYRRAFAEANLLVTDYSSVAFDFAYLEKPVLYCQFDREKIYSGTHIFKKGYFSADKDGFGPVTKNYASTAKELLSMIENNFKLADKYQKRAQAFYFHHDQKNCKRLLDVMLESNQGKSL